MLYSSNVADCVDNLFEGLYRNKHLLGFQVSKMKSWDDWAFANIFYESYSSFSVISLHDSFKAKIQLTVFAFCVWKFGLSRAVVPVCIGNCIVVLQVCVLFIVILWISDVPLKKKCIELRAITRYRHDVMYKGPGPCALRVCDHMV